MQTTFKTKPVGPYRPRILHFKSPMKSLFYLTFLMTLALSGCAHAQNGQCAGVFTDRGGQGESVTIPVLSIESLGELTGLSRGHFAGHLGPKKVFIKKLRASSHELIWLERLNSLGLGVKLYGKTKIQDQTFAVIDFVEGINTQMPMMAPGDFRLSKESVIEIRRQAEILADNQIIPVDLQFQVSNEGSKITLIDPELFKAAPDIKTAKQQTNAILNGLFMPWMMEGKIDLP